MAILMWEKTRRCSYGGKWTAKVGCACDLSIVLYRAGVVCIEVIR